MNTVALSVADVALLSALRSGPLSTREIGTRIHDHVLQSWAVEQGYEIEWKTDAEPVGARLLASCWGRELGIRWNEWEIRPRLLRLERAGEIERIQIAGHRPMLWRITFRGGAQ